MRLNPRLCIVLLSSLLAKAAAGPITLTHEDGSAKEIEYGQCTPTLHQDAQLSTIQFNTMSSCALYEDATCQSLPVATLEPLLFTQGTVLRKDNGNELVSHYFICGPA
ncbi:hypothetical protein BC941DRAFT_415513 [Chlamydoabsidia padenii]|nr:hypothetical protein BC941DRAFT_415513 [Chlamydoabsidia padenii]